MSKELTKQELVRLSWLTELRRQGDRQCQGYYELGQTVCALGLLAEIANCVPDQMDDDGDGCIAAVGGLAGLTAMQSDYVVAMNDGDVSITSCVRLHHHTFSEIADVVEGWFRKDAA